MQLLEVNNILELLYRYDTATDTNQRVHIQKKYQTYIYPDTSYIYNTIHRYTIRMKYGQLHLVTELEPFAAKITGYKQWLREVMRFKATNAIQDAMSLYRGSTMQDIAEKYKIRISDLLCN